MGSNSEVFRDMRTNDIEFTINSNDYGHMGETCGFTLVRNDGEKAWQVTRVRNKPPSLIKHKIEMAITAREDGIRANGAIENERIEKILEKMEWVSDEIEPLTLKGLDGETYMVRIDRDGLQETNMMHEKERKPEFVLNVLAWSLHC